MLRGESRSACVLVDRIVVDWSARLSDGERFGARGMAWPGRALIQEQDTAGGSCVRPQTGSRSIEAVPSHLRVACHA